MANRSAALEEVSDLDAEHLRDQIEAACSNPVDATFILVRLLIGPADQVSHLLLGQTVHDASLAQTLPDMSINILCSRSGPYPRARLVDLCHGFVRSPALPAQPTGPYRYGFVGT